MLSPRQVVELATPISRTESNFHHLKSSHRHQVLPSYPRFQELPKHFGQIRSACPFHALQKLPAHTSGQAFCPESRPTSEVVTWFAASDCSGPSKAVSGLISESFGLRGSTCESVSISSAINLRRPSYPANL
jgi:hypothetical protein